MLRFQIMQHRSLYVKTLMFTVLGFHKNSCASIFVHLKKTHIFIRIHKFMHRLVMPYLFFFFTSMKIEFRGSNQQKPRKLVLDEYQWNNSICLLRKYSNNICPDVVLVHLSLKTLSILLCVHCRRQVSDQWRVPVGLDGAPPGIVTGGCNSFPSSGRR